MNPRLTIPLVNQLEPGIRASLIASGMPFLGLPVQAVCDDLKGHGLWLFAEKLYQSVVQFCFTRLTTFTMSECYGHIDCLPN